MHQSIKPVTQHRNVGVPIGIFDLHAIMHIVKYGANAYGIPKSEENTFLIYAFLYKLRYLCSKLRDMHIVFACDSLSNKRKDIFAEYKIKRSNKTEEQIYLDKISYPQFAEIKEYVLPVIGYRNILEVDEYEADDVIAAVCMKYPENAKVIVTEDKDLYQLLSPNTAILTPRSGKYYTDINFQEEYQIDPSQWAEVKTLGGCVSDNIPGIHNITTSGVISQKCFGEKTALKYIRGEMSTKSPQYQSVSDERNKEVIARNRKLVTLPYEGMPDIKVRSNKLSFAGFLEIVEHYKFDVIKEDAGIFKYALRLQ